jgi:hypothetical protein
VPKAEAKLPGGSKTIRSLDDTYANEGLPIRRSLPPGELQHLQETRTVDFVEKISKSQRIPESQNRTLKQPKTWVGSLRFHNPKNNFQPTLHRG